MFAGQLCSTIRKNVCCSPSRIRGTNILSVEIKRILECWPRMLARPRFSPLASQIGGGLRMSKEQLRILKRLISRPFRPRFSPTENVGRAKIPKLVSRIEEFEDV